MTYSEALDCSDRRQISDGPASQERQTKVLADFFSALKFGDIPSATQSDAKRFLLDTIGCLMAGAESEMAPLVHGLGRLFGSQPEASVAGLATPQGLLGAVYANGRLANAMDFDETFPVGVHFGVGAVAAALALGESRGLHGRDVLAALVSGYELGGRVATAIGPMVHIENGAVTGYPAVWGVGAPVVVAAAGATAKSLSLDAALFAQAIGLAVSNAPLPVGAQWSNSVHLPNCKYCDAGWCAVAGVFGAISAQQGSTGFADVLDGDQGLVRMYGADVAGNAHLTRGLGSEWALSDITYKPWPSCRFTHYPMTALSRLISLSPLDAGEIEEIIIETSPLARSERFTNPSPQTFASRQFSYPHLIAMMIAGVKPGARWFDKELGESPEIAAIKQKVRVIPHPRGDEFAGDFERNQMRTLPGGVTIVKKSGETLHEETDFALGDPWDEATRFSDRDVIEKFRGLVSHPQREVVIEAVMTLERQASLAPVIELLRSSHDI